MTKNIDTSSTCHYLFGAEAEKVFTNVNIQDVEQKRAFVEKSLSLLICVNLILLTQKDGFSILNCRTKSNQCHLNALRAFHIKSQFRAMTEEDKLRRTPELRFLHLSLFLSFSLQSQPTLYAQVVYKVLKEQGLTAVTPKKHFSAFLYDEGYCRDNAARKAFSDDFKCYIQSIFISQASLNPLYQELARLAKEEDLLLKNQYTLPKLAGVAFLVDRMTREMTPFVLKVKVISYNGVGGIFVQASAPIANHESVLVFEGIASALHVSMNEFTQKAKDCSHHYIYRRTQHDPHTSCLNCRKDPLDLQPFKDRLQKATQTPREMFYALGADFVDHKQKAFKGYFEQPDKYPLLAEIYKSGKAKLKELGLEMKNPTTLSICHCYLDSAEKALDATQMRIDSSPEQTLKARGIL